MTEYKNQDILFIGDSLIEFFDWQRRFPLLQVTNLGWSGETVQELAVRSKKIASHEYNPDWIFIMIGTNNVAMDDYSFIPAYQQIIDNLSESCPNAKIVLTGLFPMQIPWISEDTIPRLNEQLKELSESNDCSYQEGWDLNSETSNIQRGFSDDGVHLSDYGYSQWANTIEKFLSTTNDK
jgi:lysophospholipase L1-like esterase